jgi:tellurite resistance protein
LERVEQGGLAHALGLSHEQALAAWQAFRAVAHADGAPGENSQRLLDVSARALGVVPDDTSSIELSAAFSSPAPRRALVDALVIPACIEGEVTAPRERAALEIAQKLGVRSHWVELLPALRRRRVLAVKRALASRSPDAKRLFRRTWREEGVLGVVRAVIFVLGLHRDTALAARFHALADCPEGSFGRAVADHFRSRGLTFPGEKNGMPERMVHHDLMHVLNGYDTDAAGECELAAFYAAFADGDAFTFFVIVLATFHLGLRVSPSVVTPARVAFDPERALAAFLRGRDLRVDVMGAWNYWELMPLPLAEAQARLGLAVPPAQ